MNCGPNFIILVMNKKRERKWRCEKKKIYNPFCIYSVSSIANVFHAD